MEQTMAEDVLITIKKKKWTWAGHIISRNDNRWTKRVTEWLQENLWEAKADRESDGEMELYYTPVHAEVL